MRTFANTDEALAFLVTLPWGNAAGTCRDGALARKFAQAGATVVTHGSNALLMRPGNAGDNFYFDEETGNGINALGVPCKSFYDYDDLPEIKKGVNREGTKLKVSVTSGDHFDPQEYYDMAKHLAETDSADIAEGNTSCGNIVLPDGTRKPIVCYDPPLFDETVAALVEGTGGKIESAIKIAPITEPSLLFGLLDTCVRRKVNYVIGVNTVANCYIAKPDGSHAITMVRGGGSGKMLQPILHGIIQMAMPILAGTTTRFIAVGGIDCGEDAYRCLALGAHGFEFNTALTRRFYDPKVIHEMIFGNEEDRKKGLLDLLVERGLPE